MRSAKFWQQFGQAPHVPTVLLVAQRGEQSLPERLPPVGPRSHGGQCPLPWPAVSFPLLGQAGRGRHPSAGRLAARHSAQACPAAGRSALGQAHGSITDWGVELILQLNHRQIGRPAVAGLPDHLQADPGERRIGVVPVLLPAPRRDADLHVALDRRCAVHLNIRPLKIRPGLEIHETKMQHRDPAAVSGAKFAAVNALILPDLLQEMLRRRGVPLSQDGRHRLLAPL